MDMSTIEKKWVDDVSFQDAWDAATAPHIFQSTATHSHNSPQNDAAFCAGVI